MPHHVKHFEFACPKPGPYHRSHVEAHVSHVDAKQADGPESLRLDGSVLYRFELSAHCCAGNSCWYGKDGNQGLPVELTETTPDSLPELGGAWVFASCTVFLALLQRYRRRHAI